MSNQSDQTTNQDENQKDNQKQKEKHSSASTQKPVANFKGISVFFIGVGVLIVLALIGGTVRTFMGHLLIPSPTLELKQSLDDQFIDGFKVAEIKDTEYKGEKARRLFVEVPSAQKVEKGYYVTLDEDNRIIRKQKLTDNELKAQLAKLKETKKE